jgi:glutathione S-transferase
VALTFYFGSGSPFAWKVWLVLEHKGVPHEAKRLSFDNDEHLSPEFRKINPRGKVPAIVDNGFALYESNAICAYLDEQYPDKPLMPKDVKGRALVRRLIGEADDSLYSATSELMSLVLYAKERDLKKITEQQQKVSDELRFWEGYLIGDYLAGAISLADFAAYPYVRMAVRTEERVAGLGIKREELPPKVGTWLKRIEAQPYYERTVPPHWKG